MNPKAYFWSHKVQKYEQFHASPGCSLYYIVKF